LARLRTASNDAGELTNLKPNLGATAKSARPVSRLAAKGQAHAPTVSDSTDALLIQSCIRGKEEAWKQLVHRYERLIYSIALRICGESDAAADVLQQVFMQVYQQLDELGNVMNLRAWLATIARRRACDYLRSTRPSEQIDGNDYPDYSDEFRRVQDRHAIETALASLPPKSRRLIELLYMSPEAPTYEQVAGQLGMPVASVGPTRIRALKKLKKLLS
jgi:RNA polymerase sigma factor (sigma-70 family)